MKKESIKTYSYRISQASKTELIVIMYDMAMEYIEDAIKTDNSAEYKENLKLAKRVIDRLSVNLDMQYDLSYELHRIYVYAGKELVMAATTRDDEHLKSIIAMLARLRKSFYEVSKQDFSGPMMHNTQQVYAGLTYSNFGSSNEISTDPVVNRGYIV